MVCEVHSLSIIYSCKAFSGQDVVLFLKVQPTKLNGESVLYVTLSGYVVFGRYRSYCFMPRSDKSRARKVKVIFKLTTNNPVNQ